jgi:microcompartment protein CcmK/EutM
MLIAKVEGSAVATLKHELLKTSKLLLVRRADVQGDAVGEPFLALDLMGAGEGELVVVTQGSSARTATGHNATPVDSAIIAILDSLQVEGKTVFRKG